jgi:hypothetical protein
MFLSVQSACFFSEPQIRVHSMECFNEAAHEFSCSLFNIAGPYHRIPGIANMPGRSKLPVPGPYALDRTFRHLFVLVGKLSLNHMSAAADPFLEILRRRGRQARPPLYRRSGDCARGRCAPVGRHRRRSESKVPEARKRNRPETRGRELRELRLRELQHSKFMGLREDKKARQLVVV